MTYAVFITAYNEQFEFSEALLVWWEKKLRKEKPRVLNLNVIEGLFSSHYILAIKDRVLTTECGTPIRSRSYRPII